MPFSTHISKKVFLMSHVPGFVRDMGSEWAMFRATVVDVASRNCGLKVIGVCCCSNQRTHGWTSSVMEAVDLNKVASKILLCRRTLEAADRYRVVRSTAASVGTDVKS